MVQPLVVQCPDGPDIVLNIIFISVDLFPSDGPAIGSPASECTPGETLWMNEGVLYYEIQ